MPNGDEGRHSTLAEMEYKPVSESTRRWQGWGALDNIDDMKRWMRKRERERAAMKGGRMRGLYGRLVRRSPALRWMVAGWRNVKGWLWAMCGFSVAILAALACSAGIWYVFWRILRLWLEDSASAGVVAFFLVPITGAVACYLGSVIPDWIRDIKREHARLEAELLHSEDKADSQETDLLSHPDTETGVLSHTGTTTEPAIHQPVHEIDQESP